MARKLSSSASERVSDLDVRMERLERLAREQEEALHIQFTRIAQIQAELDHLRKNPVKAGRARHPRILGAA